MTRKHWILGASVVALLCVVAAVAVALVSSSNDDSLSAPVGAPPAPFGQAPQELQDCLADQGVDPGGGPPSGVPDREIQRAFEACQEFLPEPPEGGAFPVPPGGGGFVPPSS